jgi:type I restriction enzyme S subunit
MGQSPPSSAYNDNLDGLPLIQGNADLNGHRLRPKVWSSVASKIGLPGDILLTVRAPVGAVALVDRRICIGRGVAALRPNNIDNEYLFYILEASEHKWRRLEQGSTFTAVGSKEVLDFTIPVPTRREDQVLVGKTLKVLHQRVLTLENLRQNLGEQKQALMQKLLTGKIRVKV